MGKATITSAGLRWLAPLPSGVANQRNAADAIGGSLEPRASRPLLTPLQAAERLGVTVHALERWRGIGGGPVFTKLSVKSVRYRQEDLDAFVEMNRRHSTAG